MDLQEIRKQIDSINREMLSLFEQRMELARSVAAYKLEHNMEVFAPAREIEIMEWVETQANPALLSYDNEFFNKLLELSRDYQSEYIEGKQKNSLPKNIKTDRLLLIPLQKGDVEAVFSLSKDPEVTTFMRFNTHNTIEEAEALIGDYTEDGNLGYKILVADTREFVGVFGFRPEQEHPEKIGISIFMGKAHWGKGYFSEILEMAKVAAVDLLEGESLWAYVVDNNIASCRGLERAGFLLDAELNFGDWDGTLYVYCYDLD